MDKLQADRLKAYGYLRSYGSLQTRLSSNPTATNKSRCNIKYQARVTVKHRILAVNERDITVELVIRANRPATRISVYNLALINTRGVALNVISSNCAQFPVINRNTVGDDFCENGRIVANGSLAPNVNHIIRYSVTPSTAMLYSDQVLILGDQIESRESTVETLFKPKSRMIQTVNNANMDQVYLDARQFGNGSVIENSRRLRLVADTWIAKPSTARMPRPACYTGFEFSYASDQWRLAEIIGICGDGSQVRLATPGATRASGAVVCPLGREFENNASASGKRRDFVIQQIAFLIVGGTRSPDSLPAGGIASGLLRLPHSSPTRTVSVTTQIEASVTSSRSHSPPNPSPTHSDPSVTHSDPSVTHSDPSVTHSDASVTHSDPSVTHSDPSVTHSDASITHSIAASGEGVDPPSLFDRVQQLIIQQLPDDYRVDWVQAQLDLELLIGMLDNICNLLNKTDSPFPDELLRSAVLDFYDTCLASQVTVLTGQDYQLIEMPMTSEAVVMGYGLVFEFDGHNLVVVAFSDHFAQGEDGILPLNYLSDATQRLDQAKVVTFNSAFEQLLRLFRHTHDEIEKFRDKL